MSGKILNGQKLADKIEKQVSNEIKNYQKLGYRPPKLIIFLIGNNFASEKYVNKKLIMCKKVGIETELILLKENITYDQFYEQIRLANINPNIDGILIQFPLPSHLSKRKIINFISAEKDVDGVNFENIGKLAQDLSTVLPCTPAGILSLLKAYKIKCMNKHVVIVGRSQIVGRPALLMFLNEKATVTITHRYTKNLEKYTKLADILISATGMPNLITKPMVKKGAIVIDVGITRNKNDKLCGDVEFDKVQKIAS